MNPLVKAMIGSGVRWLLTILAARGLAVGDAETSEIVSGALAVATLLWSWWHKHQADKAIASARAGV